MKRDSWRRIASVGLGAAAGAAAVGLAACGDDDTTADRQADVARRGAEVMPFDLDGTTHHFEPTDTGLIETVVADDPTDSEQVTLIQEHLAEEAGRFKSGDYGDPAAIHGSAMPGLSELEANADAIRITPTPLADGARISFESDDAELVDALHRWGEAQITDHGQHAEDT